MKKLYFICTFLAAMVCYSANAQQDAAYNMYMFNGLYVNPAYAGSGNVLNLVAIYRHQWVGVNGAPNTFNISADSPLKHDQYALGITLSDDKIGLSNALSVTPAFAYRPRIGKVRLSVGVQGSFTYFMVKNESANLPDYTYNDPVYMTNVSLFVPNVGVGIYVSDLESKKFFAGISVPHLLPYSLRWNKVEGMNNSSVAKLYNYYLATAGYVIGKPQSIVKVEPSFMAMWQQGMPKNIPDFDINLMLILFDRLKLGASYRTGGDMKMTGQGMVGMFEVKITSQLRAGYAFDGNISGISAVNKGSHEIMLGYDFTVNKKRIATPRYGRYF